MRSKCFRKAFAILFLTSFVQPEIFAQKNRLPGNLTESSTVAEILEYLNQTTFPHARIGIKSQRPGSSSSWHPKTGWESSTASLVFSKGFKLVSASNDCHLKLRNDDVKIYEDEKPFDLQNLAETPGPYLAEFGTWLETVSYDKGRATFSHSKDPQKTKLFGLWRTEFTSRGFFGRTVFGIEIPAIKQGAHSLISNKVSFTFDDRDMSEQFNAAFRRVIKLCQPRSTKPRWNR